jgi:hypothetical protein
MLCALLSLLLPESYNERRELGAELSAGSIMQLIVQVNPCDPDNHDHSSFLASSTKVRAIGDKKVAGTIMQSSLLKQASINENYE